VVFDVGARSLYSNRRVFVANSVAAGGDSLKIDDRGNMWGQQGGAYDPQSSACSGRCGRGHPQLRLWRGWLYCIPSNTRLISAKVKVCKTVEGD